MGAMRWKKEKKTRRRIATHHIDEMFNLAMETLDHHPERSKRYISIARMISKRHKVTFSREQKRMYCKGCNILLISGKTARVRLTGNKVVTTCLACGEVKRHPYTREKKKLFFSGAHKSKGGLIKVKGVMKKGVILSIQISGDFFIYPEESIEELENILVGKIPSDAKKAIDEYFIANDVKSPGTAPSDFKVALSKAIESGKEKN